MTKLLEMLARSCDSLLLFTQNVRRVSVYHLLDHHEPHQANLLYSVSKEPVKYIRMSVYLSVWMFVCPSVWYTVILHKPYDFETWFRFNFHCVFWTHLHVFVNYISVFIPIGHMPIQGRKSVRSLIQLNSLARNCQIHRWNFLPGKGMHVCAFWSIFDEVFEQDYKYFG